MISLKTVCFFICFLLSTCEVLVENTRQSQTPNFIRDVVSDINAKDSQTHDVFFIKLNYFNCS